MNKPGLLLSASFASALPAPAGNVAPEWVQLLPLGVVATNDGRKYNVASAAEVVAHSNAGKPPQGIFVDYDHASTPMRDGAFTREGMDTRAAGWIADIAAQGPHGEPGVWAKVDWTPAAAAAITGKEFRFLSPTFMHTKDGNIVTRIFRVALTNTPAITELPALASSQGDNPVDLKKLAVALGLPDTATFDDILNAITAMKSGNTAMCSRMKLLATAAGLAADKIGDGSAIGDNEVAAFCTKLKAPGASGEISATAQKQIDDLNKEVGALTSRLNGRDASTEVEAAIAAGKLAPAQKDWAVGYASRDPKGFKDYVEKAPVILSNGRVAPQGGAEGELSAEDIALCSKLNIKPEDYKATLAAQKEAHS